MDPRCVENIEVGWLYSVLWMCTKYPVGAGYPASKQGLRLSSVVDSSWTPWPWSPEPSLVALQKATRATKGALAHSIPPSAFCLFSPFARSPARSLAHAEVAPCPCSRLACWLQCRVIGAERRGPRRGRQARISHHLHFVLLVPTDAPWVSLGAVRPWGGFQSRLSGNTHHTHLLT